MAGQGLHLGLISGTSADAVDAALVDFSGPSPRLLAALAHEYPDELRHRILALAQSDGSTTLDQLGSLDQAIAVEFANAALAVLDQAGAIAGDLAAIGSHGQTVWHRPGAPLPYSFQLGDPNRIAERTGSRVVADFRRRDLAAGGQGAPLMSAFHAAVLGNDSEDRAALNLGGIANLTLLPSRPSEAVRGFDTGPASCLLDAWAQRHLGLRYDRDGGFASAGRCRPELLDRLLDDPYFRQATPKSTGREVFNLDWLSARIDLAAWPAEDVQASLVELSARSVADALHEQAPGTATVIACGGGVRNPALMAALARALAPARLINSQDLGIDPDYVEAMGFAWLARQTLEGLAGNLPAVTGARGPRVLGGVYPA